MSPGRERTVRSVKCFALIFGGVLCVVLYLSVQIVLSTPRVGIAADAAVPLLLKLHKTGGTSVASTLARAVYCGDAEYVRWRARLEGRAAPVSATLSESVVARRGFANWNVSTATERTALRGAHARRTKSPGAADALAALLLPSSRFLAPARKLCGNYDGHWATIAYRYFGARGMRLCAGILPARPNAKLVAVLRDPVSRFVSRLYYEIGGRSDLLLRAPFATPAEEWTPRDVAEMERLACEACASINGGHCLWRGGICDAPQEYMVVLSKHGSLMGARGSLQRRGDASDDRKALKAARSRAVRALTEDFAVVGVLEELHTFLALLARELSWPLEALLYASRKMHVSPSGGGGTAATACERPASSEDGPGRLSESRRDERLAKRLDARQAAENATGVAWSGVFPLLGWNAPKKGPLRGETREYVEGRNVDDAALWQFARDAARYKLAQSATARDAERRFDALQTAYAAGVVRDAHGFYSSCDWRYKDFARAAGAASGGGGFKGANGLDDADVNAHCRRCAADLSVAPCEIKLEVDGAVAARPITHCRTGFSERDVPGLRLKYL